MTRIQETITYQPSVHLESMREMFFSFTRILIKPLSHMSDCSLSGPQPSAMTSGAGANGAGTRTEVRLFDIKSFAWPFSETSYGTRTIRAGPLSGLLPMEITSMAKGEER